MYKIYKDKITNKDACIIRTEDGACIPFDLDNTDYQAYLKFLEEGGQPLPAEEQV